MQIKLSYLKVRSGGLFLKVVLAELNPFQPILNHEGKKLLRAVSQKLF